MRGRNWCRKRPASRIRSATACPCCWSRKRGGSTRERRPRADRRVGRYLQQSAHAPRSEEHTSELQSLMRISYAVFCLKKKNKNQHTKKTRTRRTSTTNNTYKIN